MARKFLSVITHRYPESILKAGGIGNYDLYDYADIEYVLIYCAKTRTDHPFMIANQPMMIGRIEQFEKTHLADKLFIKINGYVFSNHILVPIQKWSGETNAFIDDQYPLRAKLHTIAYRAMPWVLSSPERTPGRLTVQQAREGLAAEYNVDGNQIEIILHG